MNETIYQEGILVRIRVNDQGLKVGLLISLDFYPECGSCFWTKHILFPCQNISKKHAKAGKFTKNSSVSWRGEKTEKGEIQKMMT